VDELADSSGALHDPAALRQRLAETGYLFFRGLLPAGTVRAAAAAVLARLRDGGWVGPDGAPPGPSRFFAVHPGWQAWRPPPSAVH